VLDWVSARGEQCRAQRLRRLFNTHYTTIKGKNI
jgi:hypothetical protein